MKSKNAEDMINLQQQIYDVCEDHNNMVVVVKEDPKFYKNLTLVLDVLITYKARLNKLIEAANNDDLNYYEEWKQSHNNSDIIISL